MYIYVQYLQYNVKIGHPHTKNYAHIIIIEEQFIVQIILNELCKFFFLYFSALLMDILKEITIRYRHQFDVKEKTFFCYIE